MLIALRGPFAASFPRRDKKFTGGRCHRRAVIDNFE
jgi:hypothetical protein